MICSLDRRRLRWGSTWNLPRFDGLDVGADLTTALLEEAAKLASDVVSPLRKGG